MSGGDNFISKARRYTDIQELTPELLRLFIEKIVVHEKDVKWSKHARADCGDPLHGHWRGWEHEYHESA